MNMTTICLIRHGETDWNAAGKLQGKTDIPLNDTGRKQAMKCATYLNSEDYDELICSPLRRAKETAEIINKQLQLPFKIMEAFKERSFGKAEGMTIAERNEAYPDRNFPNQEEREDFQARVMGGIAKVKEQYPNKRILLVAHGAVINAILSELSDGEIGSGKTKLMNGCISNIHVQQDDWKVRDYNQTEHLS
ncbi:phosphatase PhoE [Virgibacillus salarius]